MKARGSSERQIVGVIRLTGGLNFREDVQVKNKHALSMLSRRFQSNLSHSVKRKLILIICVRISRSQ